MDFSFLKHFKDSPKNIGLPFNNHAAIRISIPTTKPPNAAHK
ncbi:hypothetical protein SAMN05216463_112108 [Xylanibacter ruminicola]|uniref:Uncharacterized protein n=1 Tax=Xylanibacter ruminicola TaxID=839 RepID=A0A1M6VGL1_XYLRU|nr:hypothetical protein SAMN05216463_112108 [Xylanibacter ruminicola]